MKNIALLGVGVNAMLGVGLFLPMIPILAENGLSPLQLGVLAGAFPLFEGVAGLLYPRLLRKVPPRWLMVSGQVFCALSCLFLIASSNFWWLLVGRLLGGWGGASVSIAQYLIGRSSEGSERVARLGQLGAAQAFGFVIGLAATAIAALLFTGLGSVQAAGAFATLLGICSAVAVLATTWEAPPLATAQKASLEDVPVVDLALYVLNTFVYISLAVLVSIWAGRTAGVGVAGGSAVFIALALFSMIFQAKVAAAATRAFGSAQATGGGFALSGVGVTLFALSFHPVMAIAGLIVARIGYSIIVPTTLGRILGGANAGSADQRAGWAMFAASIGSCAGPVITGAIQEDHALTTAALLLSVAALLGVGLASYSIHARRLTTLAEGLEPPA